MGWTEGAAAYQSSWLSVDRARDPATHAWRDFVRVPRPAVAALVLNRNRECVLLLWRHRFVTDSWGWEVPAGGVDAGEGPADAAVREVLEETGHHVDVVTEVVSYLADARLSDQRIHLLLTEDTGHDTAPTHPHEAERTAWFDAAAARKLLSAGLVIDGVTQIGLLMWLAGLAGSE